MRDRNEGKAISGGLVWAVCATIVLGKLFLDLGIREHYKHNPNAAQKVKFYSNAIDNLDTPAVYATGLAGLGYLLLRKEGEED